MANSSYRKKSEAAFAKGSAFVEFEHNILPLLLKDLDIEDHVPDGARVLRATFVAGRRFNNGPQEYVTCEIEWDRG